MNEEHNMRNVVNLAEALKPGMEILERLAKDSEEFCKSIREQVVSEGIVSYCIEHPSSQLEVDWERTFGMSRKNRTLTVEFLNCQICEKINEEASRKVKWMEMGIPENLVDCTFSNFDTSEPNQEEKLRVLRRFKHQCEKESGFIIARGGYGAGKTHLAVATIRQFGSGRFVTEHDLIGELRHTYSENESQDIMVNKYRTARVFVLDELTSEVKGVDIPPLLYRVLGYRYDSNLLTVITSNESMEKILEILGPRIRDRIRANYQVANFTWESYRKRT